MAEMTAEERAQAMVAEMSEHPAGDFRQIDIATATILAALEADLEACKLTAKYLDEGAAKLLVEYRKTLRYFINYHNKGIGQLTHAIAGAEAALSGEPSGKLIEWCIISGVPGKVLVDRERIRDISRDAESLVDELTGDLANRAQTVCDSICELLVLDHISGVPGKVLVDREALAEAFHCAWVSWAETILDEEVITLERAERWKAMFVPYAELPEEAKDQDREQVDLWLAALLKGTSHTTVEGVRRCSEDDVKA